MALILSINTATEHAMVCLGKETEIIASEKNEDPINHAAFIQPAIERIFQDTDFQLNNIDAVAVSAGPGSYTGLRVGLSSAKGLCFALGKPLILLNTLQIMAKEAALQINKNDALYCPMIDARRMEVFAAVFDFSGNEIVQTAPFVLTEKVFTDELSKQKKEVIFFGSGTKKWEAIAPSENNFTFTPEIARNAHGINILAQLNFERKRFSDLAYSEPLYAKNFFTTAKINDVP